MNSKWFDYKESVFEDELNNVKDQHGFGREGSGRAIMYKETKLPYCFTMEANYCVGVRINKIKGRYNVEGKEKIND